MAKLITCAAVVLLGMFAGCKESDQSGTLLVIPEGQSQAIKAVEKILVEDPNVVESALGNDFRIKIIEPDKSIDHKIVVIKPDPDVDYKITIIDPGSGHPMPKLSKRLEDEIRKQMEQAQKKLK